MTPCPPEYETVWSYLAKYEPWVLGLMADPIRGPLSDQTKAEALAERFDLDCIEVPAPELVAAAGIEKVLAFPMSVIVGIFPTNP